MYIHEFIKLKTHQILIVLKDYLFRSAIHSNTKCGNKLTYLENKQQTILIYWIKNVILIQSSDFNNTVPMIV